MNQRHYPQADDGGDGCGYVLAVVLLVLLLGVLLK